jgi:hypothetical protein
MAVQRPCAARSVLSEVRSRFCQRGSGVNSKIICERTTLESVQQVACMDSSGGRSSSSGRNRTFKRRVNGRLPNHSASLECALVTYARAAAVSTSPISCEAERRSGQRVRTRRALAPSCQRAMDLVRESVVPGTGFEPVFWFQRPVSCRLDDPGAVRRRAEGARSREPRQRFVGEERG